MPFIFAENYTKNDLNLSIFKLSMYLMDINPFAVQLQIACGPKTYRKKVAKKIGFHHIQRF